MHNQISSTLSALLQKYIAHEQAHNNALPYSTDLSHMPSPCVVESDQNGVYWQNVARSEWGDLSAVERGIELILHEDIKSFFGCQYSGDISLKWQGNDFTLLQVWSDDDFERLQENILGHLVTQRRLKLKPTVFIGTLEAELDVISICNITGEVILERLGTAKRDVLAPDLFTFLKQVEV